MQGSPKTFDKEMTSSFTLMPRYKASPPLIRGSAVHCSLPQVLGVLLGCR